MMSLQGIVEYFNDRLEYEIEAGFRPFAIQAGVVHGLFGPVRIDSKLEPIRKNAPNSKVIGYSAKQSIVANNVPAIQNEKSDNPVAFPTHPKPGHESIINLDRLSRAVHLLNYLPLANPDEPLFLDADPRHVLAVKEEHGAYLEEMIVKCGLKTCNIVISLDINAVYVRFYSALLKGLENYRSRGYQVALRFDYPDLDRAATELFSRAAPSFAALSANYLDRKHDRGILKKLIDFTGLAAEMGSHGLMLDVQDKTKANLASLANFDLVQGKYFERPAARGKRKGLSAYRGEQAHYIT